MTGVKLNAAVADDVVCLEHQGVFDVVLGVSLTARTKTGRIRRQMFAKLRTAKYLKAVASPDSASVEFEGRVQRIARVHHYGLRDRVSRRGPEVQYSQRRLLGINDEVEDITRDTFLRWLSD